MNHVDLCAGIGGMSLGIRLACPDARTVLYLEREAFCCEVLATQMQAGNLDRAPIWTDIGSFDGRPWRGVVDLVTAGIPCQPWSLAGSQRGHDDERDLSSELVRIVREMEPGLVLVENVPGFVRRGLPGLLSELAELGFDAEWGLFSASELGAPHRRRRLFVLAAHSERNTVWDEHRRGDGSSGAGAGEPRHDGTQGFLADADDPRSSGTVLDREWFRSQPSSWNQGSWAAEPDVGRVADGAPSRVDRLRALGNAVVPQVVAHAFRTLMSRFVAS